ncbi:MAG: NADH-quinone oxidoreductase subunit N [Thermodesulfovibrionales bacterium]|nr:NADH-quinone oxidoreductase subunit N [Thermodesulfovibrionales bacterium]
MNIPLPDLKPIIPELIMSIVACALLTIEVFAKDKSKDFLGVICIGVALVVMYFVPASQGITFGGMFVSDGYSSYFKLIFLINLILTILISFRFLAREDAEFGEYYSLLMFATAGMMIMASSADLILLYLGLELMALSTYILAGIKRHDNRSIESAIKYFLLGGFSSAILLFGISLLYGLTTSTNINQIAEHLKHSEKSLTLFMAMIMILSAFAFKIAAAPFHMWAPDVYEGAPTSVTAFMSVGPKAAGFAVIGRVFLTAFESIQVDWTALLIGLAILTMAVGNVLAIVQTNIKRMLAYSSIAHAGYALLGIIAGTSEGLNSVMVYLLIYAFMNIGAFTIVILLDKGEKISDYNGLSKSHPLVAAMMLVFMFSLTGIPPTAGFIGKFNIFMSAINAGYTWLVVVAVCFSAISAYYYLRVIMNMYMKPLEREAIIYPNPANGAALLISLIMIFIIGIMPSLIIGYTFDIFM